ncbi:MAG: helix-turn-helix domain-containing protein [Roseobacter sp.]|jgi:excisionase family DNA binding protein|nr:helix-turn-helix domain-containing protein [Roseobacter sp.]
MFSKPMLTVHDAADLLQVRENTVRALINDKRLRAMKIGKEWRIAEADLLAFLNEHANRDPDGDPGASDEASTDPLTQAPADRAKD